MVHYQSCDVTDWQSHVRLVLSFTQFKHCPPLHCFLARFCTLSMIPSSFGFILSQTCITALEQTWHPEHFFCAQCGKNFGKDGFHEKNGKAYCPEDYFDMFAPKCGGCHRAIMDNYITALNVQWHPDCFVCGVSPYLRFIINGFKYLNIYIGNFVTLRPIPTTYAGNYLSGNFLLSEKN